MSKVDKMRTPELATAILVVKAAIEVVFGSTTTSTFLFNSKTKGRVAVVYVGEVPNDALIKRVEVAANEIRNRNLPVRVEKRSRAEAEAAWGQKIYDKARPPADILELNVALLGDQVLVSAVKEGDFLASTGLLPPIAVPRVNHRPQKEELEFAFEFQEGLQTPSLEEDQAGRAETKAPVLARRGNPQSLEGWGRAAEELILSAMAAEGMLPADLSIRDRLKGRLNTDLAALLHGIHITSYAAGFKAKV